MELLLLAGLVVVVGVLAAAAGGAATDVLRWVTADATDVDSRAVMVASAIAVMLAALGIPLQSAAVAATARVADRTIAGHDPALGRGLAEGVRAVPRVLAAAFVAIAVVVLALVAAPLVTLVGLVGLVVTGVLALLGRRRAASWKAWGIVAIPFGLLWRVSAPAILLVPAAVLERSWPLRAARAADQAARGARWAVLGCWLVAVLAAFAIIAVPTALGGLVGGDAIAPAVGAVAQLVAAPVPIVAAVALYRRGAGPRGRVYPERAESRAPLVSSRSAVMARIATVLVVSLVIPAGMVVTTATAANAAPDDLAAITLTVTSDADTVDDTALTSQRAACETGIGECTLRAALAVAEQAAADGHAGADIRISGAPTISLVAPLSFQPDGLGDADAETPGEGATPEDEALPGGLPVPEAELRITAGTLEIFGDGTVLDGGGTLQILTVVSEYWNLSVSGTTFRNGWSDAYAAGLMAGVAQTTLHRSFFTGNSAQMGASAVFAQSLVVTASTFFDNAARGWSAYGGAIRATGAVTVTNSTFGGNSVGDQFAAGLNQGTDIYADSDMTVINSTFVQSRGGSLASPNGTSTVRNSVFSSDQTQGAFLCSGRYVGSNNVAWGGDASCPGTQGVNIRNTLVGGSVTATVPVYPLYTHPMITNPAIGAGADCPQTDALGVTRPAQGCDLGAAQVEGGTTVQLSAVPDAAVHGRATFVAKVVAASGGTPTGAVVFMIGGDTYGPIALADEPGTSDGADVASVVVSGLRGGSSYDYSADFTATAPFRNSSAGPAVYEPGRKVVDVAVACADGTAAEICTGTDWALDDENTLLLDVTVDDDRAGSVVIAADADGATVLAGPVDVQDGIAQLELVGAELVTSPVRLYTLYVSDDGEHIGTAELQPLLTVRRAPTVTLSLPAASGVFGDSASASATVTVTGAGPTPTGTVEVLGLEATLDASGRATVDLSAQAWGVSTVTAHYSGDEVYTRRSSTAVPFTLTAAPTTAQIVSATPATPHVGEAVVLSVVVAMPTTTAGLRPSGTLTIFDGSKELSGPAVTSIAGEAPGMTEYTVVISGDELSAGVHSLTARFDGNVQMRESMSPRRSLTVATAATRTVLTPSAHAVPWGSDVVFTAVVDATASGRVPTGLVVFSRGSVDIGSAQLGTCPAPNPDGCATAALTLPAASLGIGGGSFTARYVGDDALASSTADPVAVTVQRATTSLSLSGVGVVPFGATAVARLQLSSEHGATPATGAVVVSAVPLAGGGAVPLGTAVLTDGAGSLTLAIGDLPVGDYIVTAAFDGDAQFTPSAADAPLTVRAARTTIAFDGAAPASVAYNADFTVDVTVTNADGGPPPEGDVILLWLGHEIGRFTVSGTDDATGAFRQVAVPARIGEPIGFAGTSGRLYAQFQPADGFTETISDAGGTLEVTPLTVVTSLGMDAVLGDLLDATATVTIPGAPDGLLPQGTVTFTARSGQRDFGDASVTLVDGKAKLSDSSLRSILVDQAGDWSVSATFHKSDTDSRYIGIAPGDFAFHTVQLAPGASGVTATAPATVEAGVPLVVDVRVRGAAAAGGTVSLRSADGGQVWSSDAAVSGGRASISVTLPQTMPLGTETWFEVEYSGDGTLDGSVSSPFSVTLIPTVSTITITTTLAPDGPQPGIVGGKVPYVAHTSSTLGAVPGSVFLYRDDITIGQAVVDENGDASFSVAANVAWAGTLRADFVPSVARMAGSSASFAHSWRMAPVEVTLESINGAVIGTPARATVWLRLDHTKMPLVFGDALPTRLPEGEVVISDGAGASCTTRAVPSDFVNAHVASCFLTFITSGQKQLTATYAGDDVFEPGSASAGAAVVRGTPTIGLGVADRSWAGSSVLPVSWEIGRASGGTISVLRGDAVVCTSTQLRGSCDVPLPAYRDTANGDLLTLRYSGSAGWDAASAEVQGSIIACIPAGPVAYTPAGSATATLDGEPNCGSGTGYLAGTSVIVRAAAAEGRAISRMTNSGVSIPDVSLFERGKTASVMTSPSLLIENGVPRPFTIGIHTEALCIPIDVRALGISDRLTALNIIRWTPQAQCGGYSRVQGSLVETLVAVGSTLDVEVVPRDIPAHVQFNGWAGVSGDSARALTYRYPITLDTTVITADFSPVCYQMPTVVQPTGGRIETRFPATNCHDPITDTRGWVYGTYGSGDLIDTVGGRTWFERWTGDTSRYTGHPTLVHALGTPSGTAPTRPFSFTITDRPFQISASYGSCVMLSTAQLGDRTYGRLSIDTPSNCPAGRGAVEQPWYRIGTLVTLTAAVSEAGAALRPGAQFFGWDGLGLSARDSINPTVTTTVVADTTVTGSFGRYADCRPLYISAVPASAIRAEVTWTDGNGNACEGLNGGSFYDQGTSGAGIQVSPVPTSAAGEGAEIVFAWSTSVLGSTAGETESRVFDRQTDLNLALYGPSTIVAYACEFVRIDALVTAPDGTPAGQLGATNADPVSKDRLAGLVATSDADCATGSDPKSQWGGYAWQAGTQLLPIVTADSAAYRFTGWSGDARGTGETPDAPVSLVGSGTTSGDDFDFTIRANFQAICHTLSLPSDAGKLEVLTVPNCPNTDAAKRMYLGGTSVVLHATDRDGAVFRHWVSGTDAIDSGDPRWASVTMTGDKSVVPYYSSKSVGETLAGVGTQVGDIMAVAAKKLLGVVTAAATAYMKLLVAKVSLLTDGLGYIAMGLEAAGIRGTVIDGMKTASTMMNSVLSLLWAPMDCLTAWSAGGTNTVFYAAQNLVGSVAVARLSQETVAQQAAGGRQSSFTQLIEKAKKIKAAVAPVATTAASTLLATKAAYTAAESGNIGIELTAHDAWGSEASISVYSACMGQRSGAALDTMNTSLDAVSFR